MLDKFLTAMVRTLAVIIVVMIGVIGYKLYDYRYEILNGTVEPTLEKSVYSSKYFEIGLGDIALENNRIELDILNRKNKDLDIQLTSIKFNDKEVEAKFQASVSPYEELLDSIIIENMDQDLKLETIEMEFKIDNKHDINISVNIVQK